MDDAVSKALQHTETTRVVKQTACKVWPDGKL